MTEFSPPSTVAAITRSRYSVRHELDLVVERVDIQTALDLLWADLMSLYHEAQTVTIVGRDGVERPDRPTRSLNEIRKGRENNDLVPTVARMMRRVTKRAGILAEASRRDLMVETRIVLDETRPYHFLFSEKTVELAHQRLRELGSA